MIRVMGPREALGIRIKTLRHERGLTQDALSERSQRSVDTLSLIERGLNWPSVETLELIAGGLDVSVSDLLNDLITEASQQDDLIVVAKEALKRIDQRDLRLAVALLQTMVQESK